MLISRKSLWGKKKLVLSQNKRSHSLETFERNHEKFGTVKLNKDPTTINWEWYKLRIGNSDL